MRNDKLISPTRHGRSKRSRSPPARASLSDAQGTATTDPQPKHTRYVWVSAQKTLTGTQETRRLICPLHFRRPEPPSMENLDVCALFEWRTQRLQQGTKELTKRIQVRQPTESACYRFLQEYQTIGKKKAEGRSGMKRTSVIFRISQHKENAWHWLCRSSPCWRRTFQDPNTPSQPKPAAIRQDIETPYQVSSKHRRLDGKGKGTTLVQIRSRGHLQGWFTHLSPGPERTTTPSYACVSATRDSR